MNVITEWFGKFGRVSGVAGDGDHREVGKEIDHQDLEGKHGEIGDKEGSDSDRKEITYVGSQSHFNVFAGVGEDQPTFFDAV